MKVQDDDDHLIIVALRVLYEYMFTCTLISLYDICRSLSIASSHLDLELQKLPTQTIASPSGSGRLRLEHLNKNEYNIGLGMDSIRDARFRVSLSSTGGRERERNLRHVQVSNENKEDFGGGGTNDRLHILSDSNTRIGLCLLARR